MVRSRDVGNGAPARARWRIRGEALQGLGSVFVCIMKVGFSVLAAFTTVVVTGASRTFTVRNNCPYTIW